MAILELPLEKSTDGRPLYVQLSDAIEAGIHADRLVVGQRMPSDKALARDLRISPLTVAKAYQKLAEKGVLNRHVGRGTFVARKRQRAGVVTMLAGDYVENWTGVIAAGLSSVLAASGFRLEVAPPFNRNPVRERELLDGIDPGSVDGVFAMTHAGSEPLYTELAARGVAVVLGGRHYAKLPHVHFDDLRIGQLAAEHLVANDARECMAIVENYDVARERLYGFQLGLARAGLDLPEDHVFFVGGPALTERELDALLAMALPRGIFAHSDSFLVQLYHALLKAGRADEAGALLMVGVGNRYEHHRVPFASVDYNLRALGVEAGRYLVELIEGGLKPAPGQSLGRKILPELHNHVAPHAT